MYVCVCSMLAMGGDFSLDDVCQSCAAELTTLLTHFNYDAVGLRKSKVEPQVSYPDIPAATGWVPDSEGYHQHRLTCHTPSDGAGLTHHSSMYLGKF